MKHDPMTKARKWARENPMTAKATGVTEAIKHAAECRKKLRGLCDGVRSYLHQLDGVMKLPDSHERGKQIAKLSNNLEWLNDTVRHFALGDDL